ncbi:hypothetical protein IIV31_039R [Armadillidium vulgare iridescent virus]|uniref:Uncharacterized protein n=1 Tax=Armadillidium vulgare iridescent virus TaxID=72201 RepID=A0A068QKC7_9VIRU|nr:hypothetical protein IIV31_039R [Armadillidium vulgare iridescent virus]CCV02411.1 hypothetical protein IIV31_039R [Armadillidium vulgare iridescent virus]
MISFSSITDRPKGNLDDVSDWYITNTIIKDPPKGITTRRIIKVGENNDILDAEDESTSRNDAIRQFATNVNPMVAVDYNNSGPTNGGIQSGTQAFLPYRIIKDGAFRPPILYQQDTLPLSRLPRNTTSVNTSAEWIDFSKWERPTADAVKYKEVLNTIRTTPMCSNKGYNFKTGTDQPYDIVYHIENKPQRIKQIYAGEEEPGFGVLDNIGKNVVDGVTVEGFTPPQQIRYGRDGEDGLIEGSSGRTPMPKIDSSWYQHPNITFKDPMNLHIATNANGIQKDNLNRSDVRTERNLPLCSFNPVKQPSFPKHLKIHFNDSENSNKGIKDQRFQRETFSFQNAGARPMTVQLANMGVNRPM